MLKFIIAAVSILISSAAGAAGPWYVFGGAGLSRSGGDGDTALTAGAGYRLNQTFALEASFVNLGAVRAESSDAPATGGTAHTARTWDASAFGLSALARAATFGPVSLWGKASLYRVRGDFENRTDILSGGTSTPAGKVEASGSSIAPSLGVGATHDLMPNVALRAFGEVIAKKSGTFGEGNDIGSLKLFTLTFSYSF